MKDFGHWSVFKEVDINDYIGFVYVITFENGKKYIGAKKIWKRIKTAPSTFKRGPKRGFEESDWKNYTSSSNELNSILESGTPAKEYIIVGWYPTWGKTLMAEMEMQLANDVLKDPTWLNKQIGGHFNPNCFDDLTEEDIKRWADWEKGNEHVSWPVMYKIGQKTKYVNPINVQQYLDNGWDFGRSKSEKLSIMSSVVKYKIWDYLEHKEVEVINSAEFARKNNISASHLTHLLKGNLDLIKDRWGLSPEISRQRYKFSLADDSAKFLTNGEAESYFSLPRGSLNKLIKEGKVKRLKVETKAEHIKKLSALNLIETVKKESIKNIQINSFREISFEMNSAEKESTIEWLQSYINYLKNN